LSQQGIVAAPVKTEAAPKKYGKFVVVPNNSGSDGKSNS